MRTTILHWTFWAAVIATLGLGLYSGHAIAEPIFAAEADGIRIVLHDDPCAMPNEWALPKRATWTEKGVTTEGCVGYVPEEKAFYLLWADGTRTKIHASHFKRVLGV